VSGTVVTAAAIFLLTYAVLGLGALPPLRLDRAGATLVGATLMVACGVVTPAQAAGAIDIGTLALLFGMMVVAANLRLAGFFGWTVARVLGVTRSPRLLLVLTTWLSGVLSALVVNDTVCVLLTPLVLELAAHAGLPPVPFLLALAMGANAGSVATVVGNPQNMMIASLGGIPYARFAGALVPVALEDRRLARGPAHGRAGRRARLRGTRRGAQQPREQRACRHAPRQGRCGRARPGARAAAARHGEHARRQPDARGLGREPHRGLAGGAARTPGVLGVHAGRGAGHAAHAGLGCVVARAVRHGA
jgi:hypothetical protein